MMENAVIPAKIPRLSCWSSSVASSSLFFAARGTARLARLDAFFFEAYRTTIRARRQSFVHRSPRAIDYKELHHSSARPRTPPRALHRPSRARSFRKKQTT